MFNPYTAKVGDKVRVTFKDGDVVDMAISRIDKPGSGGTSEASGPVVIAHIRPGGYVMDLGSFIVKSVEVIV